jgi:dihydrofolate reductase
MKTVDALLIGRRTYEVMLKGGQTSYPGATNYVFTRSKRNAARFERALSRKNGKVHVVTEDATGFVARRNQEKHRSSVAALAGSLSSTT